MQRTEQKNEIIIITLYFFSQSTNPPQVKVSPQISPIPFSYLFLFILFQFLNFQLLQAAKTHLLDNDFNK